MQLMQACERLVKAGYFVSNQPARLLAQGFSEMQVLFKRPTIIVLSPGETLSYVSLSVTSHTKTTKNLLYTYITIQTSYTTVIIIRL